MAGAFPNASTGMGSIEVLEARGIFKRTVAEPGVAILALPLGSPLAIQPVPLSLSWLYSLSP